MINETIYYTFPQWLIFAGIFVIIYGWVEDKKTFRIIGASIMVLLGIISLIVLSGDYFVAAEFITPEEIARQEFDGEIIDEVPLQRKLFPAYLGFVVSAFLALPAIYLDLKNSNKYRWFIVASGLTALFGFFVIVGAVRTL